MTVYFCSLSSFAGIVPGAHHIHVRLRWGERGEEDLFPPTRPNGYFDTREEAIARAKEWFKMRRSSGDWLILGNKVYGGPQEVLLGPPNKVNLAREIWEKYKTTRPSRENPKAQERLERKWDQLLGYPPGSG